MLQRTSLGQRVALIYFVRSSVATILMMAGIPFLYETRCPAADLRGKVVLRESPEQGVSKATVQCITYFIGTIGAAGPSGRGTDFSLTTDDQGKFHTHWAPWDSLVEARSADGSRAALIRIGHEERNIILPIAPVAIAVGRIVDKTTGRPLAKREVQLQLVKQIDPPNQAFRYFKVGEATKTNARGEYSIAVPQGWEFSVTVRTERNPSGEKAPWFRSLGTVRADKPDKIDLGEFKFTEFDASYRPRGTPPNDVEMIVRVLDEQGRLIPQAEVMLHTHRHGYKKWVRSKSGKVFLGHFAIGAETTPIDVIARAEGFASTTVRFEGADREKLWTDEATVTLRRGVPVDLRIHLPEGMHWPDELLPEIYFAELHERVRSVNSPISTHRQSTDWKLLGPASTTTGGFTFRLTPETPPFFVGVFAPGFLRSFEWGPFSAADVKNGVLEIQVERPAVLKMRFGSGNEAAEQLPFKKSSFVVLMKAPGVKNAAHFMASEIGESGSQDVTLRDLPPGDYIVQLRTEPKPDVQPIAGTDANPGAFFDSRMITLGPGDEERIDVEYLPLKLDAFRGDRTALIRLINADGSPAVGRQAQISFFTENYGYLPVYAGKTPDSGEIRLDHVTANSPTADARYQLEVDDSRVASFQFATDRPVEEFKFQLPPKSGDLAPDIALIAVGNGESIKLSDLRGQIVCLEFWATWCGPCQEPMAKLERLAAEKRDAWGGRVRFISLSIDDSPKSVALHFERNGWHLVEQYWAGSDEEINFDAPAAKAFGLDGVPMSYLIDRDGRILWCGHPSSADPSLAARIESALEEN